MKLVQGGRDHPPSGAQELAQGRAPKRRHPASVGLANAGLSYNSDTVWQLEGKAIELRGLLIG